MPIARVVRLTLQRLEARPPWLRWLESAPLAVQEADRLARHVFIRRQLLCALAAVCILGVAKHFGGLASQPVVALALSASGMVALVWPTHIWYFALAAHRSIASSTGSLALRLRALAVVGFVLAGLLGIAIVSLIGILIAVAVIQ